MLLTKLTTSSITVLLLLISSSYISSAEQLHTKKPKKTHKTHKTHNKPNTTSTITGEDCGSEEAVTLVSVIFPQFSSQPDISSPHPPRSSSAIVILKWSISSARLQQMANAKKNVKESTIYTSSEIVPAGAAIATTT